MTSLARIIREQGATLTPTLSLGEGEGAVPMPSPPQGERDRVGGSVGRGRRVRQFTALGACRSKRHWATRNTATGGRSASSAGSAGAPCSWGEVRKGGGAPPPSFLGRIIRAHDKVLW